VVFQESSEGGTWSGNSLSNISIDGDRISDDWTSELSGVASDRNGEDMLYFNSSSRGIGGEKEHEIGGEGQCHAQRPPILSV
jgi:hypothetical protein